MQLIFREKIIIQEVEETRSEVYFEEKIELFLHKIVKVWFAGIFVIGIPYFLYICLQFMLQF